MLLNQIFLYKNGSRNYIYLVVSGDRTLFTNEETSAGKKYDKTLICQMIDFLIDNIHIKIDNHLLRQHFGISMGTNYAPLLANLFSYSYEVEFLRSMSKTNKKMTKAFNLTSRYIENLIINNPRFKQFLKVIWAVSETLEQRNVVSYLDLLIGILNGDLVCSILTRGMHLISILSIFLTYLGVFQLPQVMVQRSHS